MDHKIRRATTSLIIIFHHYIVVSPSDNIKYYTHPESDDRLPAGGLAYYETRLNNKVGFMFQYPR